MSPEDIKRIAREFKEYRNQGGSKSFQTWLHRYYPEAFKTDNARDILDAYLEIIE